ncbi:hypothetical protein PsorP6_010454 [Peronosclerospora sorghi]|uniref:Uncharacterized protein n=1 Tax=Peronosclerospora sorghi TaxID=230839 RepID=A0ACC0VV37_9STRA|nr:hypothetical protein PsorP6_010454 [Peronosclerospora sorghi]
MIDSRPRTRIQSSRPSFSARKAVIKVRKTSDVVFLKVRREETLLPLSEASRSLRKKMDGISVYGANRKRRKTNETSRKDLKSTRIAEEEENSSDVNANAHASIYRRSACGNCQCNGIVDAPTATLDADDVIDASTMDSSDVAAIDFIPRAKLRQCITAAHAVSVIPTYSRK